MQASLSHSCQQITLDIDKSSGSMTLGYLLMKIKIKHTFTKILTDSCGLGSFQHFFFKICFMNDSGH